jgi:hypothetical protein
MTMEAKIGVMGPQIKGCQESTEIEEKWIFSCSLGEWSFAIP